MEIKYPKRLETVSPLSMTSYPYLFMMGPVRGQNSNALDEPKENIFYE
jgi:hypothetical protein